MSNDKIEKFVEELNKLQEKYGVIIGADYIESTDFNSEEGHFVNNVIPYNVLTDTKGNMYLLDDFDKKDFECVNCGMNVDIHNAFCSEVCINEFHNFNN